MVSHKKEFLYWIESQVDAPAHPENTSSSFTTPLNSPKLLFGNWSVGLTEIFVPNYHLNVYAPMNRFVFGTTHLKESELMWPKEGSPDAVHFRIIRARPAAGPLLEDKNKTVSEEDQEEEEEEEDSTDGRKRNRTLGDSTDGRKRPRTESFDSDGVGGVVPDREGADNVDGGSDSDDDDEYDPMEEIHKRERREKRRRVRRLLDKEEMLDLPERALQFEFTIPEGRYTADEFCRRFNMALSAATRRKKEYRPLYWDPQSKRIVMCLVNGDGMIFPNARLRQLMGFDEPKRVGNDYVAGKVMSDLRQQGHTIRTLPHPASFSLYTQTMHIYSDIAASSGVGNESCNILRVVDLDGEPSDGDTIHREFINTMFVPVILNSFNSIKIDIRDDVGAPMQFIRGHVKLCLHFIQGEPYLGD